MTTVAGRAPSDEAEMATAEVRKAELLEQAAAAGGELLESSVERGQEQPAGGSVNGGSVTGGDIDTAGLLALYYRHVPVEDLAGWSPAEVRGAALSHLAAARQRPAGRASVRAFTPTAAGQGWSTGRTVLEVVTDDMPFLVDSVTAELSRQGRGIRLVIHPTVTVSRDDKGRLQEVPDHDGVLESWIHIEIDRVTRTSELEVIALDVRRVLGDVRAAVQDWDAMAQVAKRTADELGGATPAPDVDRAEVAEAAALLRWLATRATLLGYQDYAFGDGAVATPVPGTGLGLLRGDSSQPRTPPPLPPRTPAPGDRRLLVIGKATSRSTVHRPSYLDSVAVRTYDDAGRPVGERRFFGLLAAAALRESVLRIPFLRRKVQTVIDRSGFPPQSHSGKDLLQILETYPLDELFQAGVDDLERVAHAVIRLQERRQLRLFLRRDDDRTAVSCVVYLPRDLYTRAVRLHLEELLRESFAATSIDYTARVTESVLARLYFVARVEPGQTIRDVDAGELERRAAELARSWVDDFGQALTARLGEQEANRLLRDFPDVFPDAYQADFSPETAVEDLKRVDALAAEGGLGLNLYRPAGSPQDELRFKVYSSRPVSLSAVLPVLQHMAVEVIDSRPYRLRDGAGAQSFVYDFGLKAAGELHHGATGLGRLFQDAFAAVWRGQAESDGYNALVLRAGLGWRQVVVLRAYGRYLRQAGALFSPDYVERCVVAQAPVARLLVRLFELQFDPDLELAAGGSREELCQAVVQDIETAIEAVMSLDEDRILHSFLRVVRATVRTNVFQRSDTGARHPDYVCVKLDPASVPDLPKPRPTHEIWVYSPRVEGVHLRFGNVARGGLRWSDRREDFRTEILGLVKAQSVKNAVIVPVGAKGGFYAKRLPDPLVDREAWLAEGVASYRTFIAGMLDLTDNLDNGRVVPPPRVLRRDDDDTYLVVAADKGTATFSDIANALAIEHGFWLGDAFASGGSAGYDHKEMGITARGAWESVKRHFREIGVDTQTQDVTVVGIGDMSGDVFGNGMLLSRHLRLVAVFDHRHIFLDPDPDPGASFAERQRLFTLPRSSWADYDTALLSAGGGVYARSAKAVPVSPQVRDRLGLPDDTVSLTPGELMSAILQAPVDLLWNGAIGTYVKSSAESHAAVGDKANDAVRIDGAQLRCKVVGEGGNLGLTQLGRIEAARSGVRLNTDAIDNSAGVDCSDHEVNIKILLDRAIQGGALPEGERNDLLHSMTGDVAALVLRDNYEQNILLGNARASAGPMVSVHRRYIRALEEAGALDRALEFLPSGRELDARASAGAGLSSPELAVLAAYGKNTLKARLLATSVPDDPWFQRELTRYFPTVLSERFGDLFTDHPLRRQIVTTGIVNDLVNHAGITFAFRAEDETGAGTAEVVRAYTVAREVFALRDYWTEIEQLDARLPTKVQVALHVEGRRMVDRVVRWLLQGRRSVDVSAELQRFGQPIAELLPIVPDLVRGAERVALFAVEAEFRAQGVPPELAIHSARLLHAFHLLHVVELATTLDQPAAEVAELHYALSALFDVDTLLTRITLLPRADRWQALARSALRDDLYAALAGLTGDVLRSTPAGPVAARLAAWERANAQVLARSRTRLKEIAAGETFDLATVSVAVRSLRSVLRD